MARERKNYQVRTNTGDVVASPTVTVFDSGTANLSSIFSDDVGAGTPLANPFTGDANGRAFFHASDGLYDVQFSHASITTYTLGAEDFVFQAAGGGGGITSLNTQVGATQTFSTGSGGADFNISSAANVHTFNLPNSSSITRGALTSADYTTFSNKLGSLNGLTGGTQTFVTGTAGVNFNITSAGTTHTFNIPIASAVNTGLLSSANWTTFNNKEPAIAAGTALQYYRGDKTFQTLNTSVVPESGNLYYTDARARLALSATAPVVYVGATGVISMPAATGAVDGYLTAANFTTFNNKIGSLNGSTVVTQTFLT